MIDPPDTLPSLRLIVRLQNLAVQGPDGMVEELEDARRRAALCLGSPDMKAWRFTKAAPYLSSEGCWWFPLKSKQSSGYLRHRPMMTSPTFYCLVIGQPDKDGPDRHDGLDRFDVRVRDEFEAGKAPEQITHRKSVERKLIADGVPKEWAREWARQTAILDWK